MTAMARLSRSLGCSAAAKDARTLRMLVDERGDSIASELDYELTRTDCPPPRLAGVPP